MSVYCDERRGKKKHWRYRAKIRLHDGRTERISGTPAINTKLGALAAERAHIERALRGQSDGRAGKEGGAHTHAFHRRGLVAHVPHRPRQSTDHDPGEGNSHPASPEAGAGAPPSHRHQRPERDGAVRGSAHARTLTEGKAPQEGLKRRRREEEKLRATRERNRKPRGLKDKSIRNIRTTLSTILSSAVEWGYLAAMPRLPKVKVDDPQWEWYRAEEARRLVAAARDEWERAMLLFPLATGARMGEQIAIRWGDIDWMSRMVHIRQSAPNGRRSPARRADGTGPCRSPRSSSARCAPSSTRASSCS